MDEPEIAARTPATVELEAGKNYAWCACGRSSEGALCDGSHGPTPFRPKLFQPEASGPAALCRCKRTNSPPYCDGSHAALG